MTESITIRHSTSADDGRLDRLAQLDESSAPTGTAWLAELDGTLIAAVDEHDGRAIADPFVPTADVVALLKRLSGRQPAFGWLRR